MPILGFSIPEFQPALVNRAAVLTLHVKTYRLISTPARTPFPLLNSELSLILITQKSSGGSRKKIYGGLAPHHLGGNNG